MEETRKRAGEEEGKAAKKLREMEERTQDGFDEDDVMAWLVFDGEDNETAADELMKLLEHSSAEGDASGCYGFRVKFIDDPYATPVVFQSSSSYITINGNEETCGSSFSDSDASVMASVDARGIVDIYGRGGGAWGSSAGEMDGWDGGFGGWDDGWLASFLGQD